MVLVYWYLENDICYKLHIKKCVNAAWSPSEPSITIPGVSNLFGFVLFTFILFHLKWSVERVIARKTIKNFLLLLYNSWNIKWRFTKKVCESFQVQSNWKNKWISSIPRKKRTPIANPAVSAFHFEGNNLIRYDKFKRKDGL